MARKQMNKNFIVGWIAYEQVNLVPINFTERALKYLYVDKLDPESKIWILRPGRILDYESDSKVD